MIIFLAFLITAVVCNAIWVAVFTVSYRRGLFIRNVREEEILEGTIVDRPRRPEEAFFDEHDLAAAEAHQERPEFVHTEILLNGIRAGPGGTVPPEKEGSWWRR